MTKCVLLADDHIQEDLAQSFKTSYGVDFKFVNAVSSEDLTENETKQEATLKDIANAEFEEIVGIGHGRFGAIKYFGESWHPAALLARINIKYGRFYACCLTEGEDYKEKYSDLLAKETAVILNSGGRPSSSTLNIYFVLNNLSRKRDKITNLEIAKDFLECLLYPEDHIFIWKDKDGKLCQFEFRLPELNEEKTKDLTEDQLAAFNLQNISKAAANFIEYIGSINFINLEEKKLLLDQYFGKASDLSAKDNQSALLVEKVDLVAFDKPLTDESNRSKKIALYNQMALYTFSFMRDSITIKAYLDVINLQMPEVRNLLSYLGDTIVDNNQNKHNLRFFGLVTFILENRSDKFCKEAIETILKNKDINPFEQIEEAISHFCYYGGAEKLSLLLNYPISQDYIKQNSAHYSEHLKVALEKRHLTTIKALLEGNSLLDRAASIAILNAISKQKWLNDPQLRSEEQLDDVMIPLMDKIVEVPNQNSGSFYTILLKLCLIRSEQAINKMLTALEKDPTLNNPKVNLSCFNNILNKIDSNTLPILHSLLRNKSICILPDESPNPYIAIFNKVLAINGQDHDPARKTEVLRLILDQVLTDKEFPAHSNSILEKLAESDEIDNIIKVINCQKDEMDLSTIKVTMLNALLRELCNAGNTAAIVKVVVGLKNSKQMDSQQALSYVYDMSYTDFEKLINDHEISQILAKSTKPTLLAHICGDRSQSPDTRSSSFKLVTNVLINGKNNNINSSLSETDPLETPFFIACQAGNKQLAAMLSGSAFSNLISFSKTEFGSAYEVVNARYNYDINFRRGILIMAAKRNPNCWEAVLDQIVTREDLQHFLTQIYLASEGSSNVMANDVNLQSLVGVIQKKFTPTQINSLLKCATRANYQELLSALPVPNEKELSGDNKTILEHKSVNAINTSNSIGIDKK